MSISPGRPDDSTGEFQGLSTPGFPSNVAMEIAAASDMGHTRKNNEDSYFAARLTRSLGVASTSLHPPDRIPTSRNVGHLLIVADGMGGALAGERASALAVESIVASVLDNVRGIAPATQIEEDGLVSQLRAALERADRAVIKVSREDPEFEGLGTTLTVAYTLGDLLYIAHAGDSRAYLHRAGKLRRVTRDHTLVQMMISGGLLSEEGARTHQKRNVVTNVIGGPSEGVFAEIHKVPLLDGDLILLCSDGLSEPVDDRAIAAILDRHPEPEAAAQALIAAALDGGGPDNVSVVLGRVRFLD